jgi:GntR family carbon starvation induced transcriptional regulator
MKPATPTLEKTRTEAASVAIADGIMSGVLQPGLKLRIRELSERFGFGPTPLREALAGLASRGLVEAEGQKGFRVAPVSREDLNDLMQARTVVETGALRLAIANGDAAWEAGIVSALHRIKLFCEARPSDVAAAATAFEKANSDFHDALIAACGSPRLIALQRSLFDQTRRYRSLMSLKRVKGGKMGEYEAHRELADLAMARKADAACEALAQHNRLTLQLVFGAEGPLRLKA